MTTLNAIARLSSLNSKAGRCFSAPGAMPSMTWHASRGRRLHCLQRCQVAFTAAQAWGADQTFTQLHNELNVEIGGQ